MEISAGPKDYFSSHAQLYAAFRPTYPEELYQFIFDHVKEKSIAWDCATGNGQVAGFLSKHFKDVYATDISQQQLDNAIQADNIHYSLSPAEITTFPDNNVDLITVGQALHWFDLDKFYREVKRVSKPNGVLAVWGYSFLSISSTIDPLILDFYENTVGPYWDNARKLVEDSYRSIPFPFKEIQTPAFYNKFRWNLEQLEGYLTTWSSTQKYIRENNFNPVIPLLEKIKPLWEIEFQEITFPVFMRTGIIQSRVH